MTFPFFRRETLHRRRVPRGVPRHLSPHLMRDIGLDPWPAPPSLRSHLYW
ncbi:hypothetical protein roselon_01277 [Roseibacterium elongatum DSM 19469]|uniref:Uncharacterized protein n=2 Tax=Roseicyclus elongatus TaxID=159346 RepID=W8SM95_9RHOB|nr:hypothetical protein roselon_01277 [Roseibacterium elongatum DSM 19469]